LRLDQQIGAHANENAKEDARKQRNAKKSCLSQSSSEIVRLIWRISKSSAQVLVSWLTGQVPLGESPCPASAFTGTW
jgi:hypothetical protein